MTSTTSTDLILLDTNVLVYALDPADRRKQRVAIDLLDALAIPRRGSISVQCLTECFNAITRKIAQPIPFARGAEHVEDFASTFVVFDLTSEVVRSACHAVARTQITLWDALIWSVARHNSIATVLTEDMQHRTVIEGVQYLNPFASDADLQALISPRTDE
jgi:predicted nucleic acid-binding protein